ncbi:MAG TPA: nucleotidyltransferase domain-containing protein [Gaiellaceae bacterium]|nr:nucleotidyltransferase domain-containing protein [Gaiellaceae bacterium]
MRDVRLVGSRAEGRATALSDWDLRVETTDFAAVAESLPLLLRSLEPLAQQWDPLCPEYCWMTIFRGPEKVDLIFADEPHAIEPPWQPSRERLAAIDAHFWDWMLWLGGKQLAGRDDVVGAELEKLFHHLLAPLGVERAPGSIVEAVASYREARADAERRFGIEVGRELESAVAPVLG